MAALMKILALIVQQCELSAQLAHRMVCFWRYQRYCELPKIHNCVSF